MYTRARANVCIVQLYFFYYKKEQRIKKNPIFAP